MKPKTYTKQVVALAAVLAVAGPAAAQRPMPRPMHFEKYLVETGFHSGPAGDQESILLDGQVIRQEPKLVYSGSVNVPRSPWLRIYFKDFHLGRGSYVRLTSVADGSDQWLDATAMKNWNNASAVFNGDEIGIELFAGPGDTGVFLDIKNILVGEWETIPEGNQVFTICGANDDRVATNDNRAVRMYFGGCSAWLISNGACLTAGHCTDFDPDQGGPMLPDGISDIGQFLEVNVPLSTAAGNTVAAAANDQYPINVGSEVWRFDGENQGLGKDWSVFGVNPNTGPNPNIHRAYGFFRTSNNLPANGTTLRITGFGSDGGTANFTEQTHTGPFNGEFTGNAAADFFLQYSVDTTGGNSGSPVFQNAGNQFALGIHTNAGCTSGGGSNSGTSFEVNALETAMADFPGVNTFYADTISNTPSELGAIFQPSHTIPLAYSQTTNGGILSIVQGNYTNAAGNTGVFGDDTKGMTWDAPVGTVTIGD